MGFRGSRVQTPPSRLLEGGSTITGPSAPLLPPLLPRCNFMRQPRFERGTFGSGGGAGQRSPTLAVAASSTYGGFRLASVGWRRPRCYHRCYHGVASPSVCWSSAPPYGLS